MPDPVTTKTMNLTDARQNFSHVITQVFRGEARVLVEKSGIPVAAIISAQDLERFAQMEREREKDFAVLDEVGDAFKDVPVEVIEREVARALAVVRRESRSDREQFARPT